MSLPRIGAVAMLNRFAIGVTSQGHVLIGFAPTAHEPLTKENALNLAAWLTVLARIEDEELLSARREVENAPELEGR